FVRRRRLFPRLKEIRKPFSSPIFCTRRRTHPFSSVTRLSVFQELQKAVPGSVRKPLQKIEERKRSTSFTSRLHKDLFQNKSTLHRSAGYHHQSQLQEFGVVIPD